MSRFLLVTADTGFEQRVLQAVQGAIPGDVQTIRDVILPDTPGQLLQADTDRPEVVLLGPGVNLDRAMALASVFNVQHPDISLVLVSGAGPDVALHAMRNGIRDILEPDAGQDTIRVLLERVSRAGAGRRRGTEQENSAGRVITVTSAKGGVGKTTVAANLAIGLGKIHPMSTVLVDLDAQFGDVATVLRLEPEHTLKDAVTGASAQDSMVLKTFLSVHRGSIYALCAPEDPSEGDRITGADITHLLKQLAGEFRNVIVDTTPGLGELTLAALESSTDAVLICGMDVPGVRGLRKEMDVLTRLNLTPPNRHLVVNSAENGGGLTIRDIEATLGAPVDVTIPRSKDLAYSINEGEPLLLQNTRDKAAKELHRLVDRFNPAAAPARKGLHRRAVIA